VGADVKPSWEASQPAAARSLSPNIKSRKKVAALFKRAPAPAPVQAPEAAVPAQAPSPVASTTEES
jgi:hypothetical protein